MTKALTKTDAKRVAEDIECKMLVAQPPHAGDVVSFAEPTRRYCAFKGVDLDDMEALTRRQREDARRIQKLIAAR